jgi:protein AroM
VKSQRTILYPGPLLREVVRSLDVDRLGVLTPAAEQMEGQRARWTGLAGRIIVDTASPYRPGPGLEEAAERLRVAEVDVVVMDCIGYTKQMKRVVSEAVRRPVVAASTLVTRVAAELLG